jgi:hypothetical protein
MAQAFMIFRLPLTGTDELITDAGFKRAGNKCGMINDE